MVFISLRIPCFSYSPSLQTRLRSISLCKSVSQHNIQFGSRHLEFKLWLRTHARLWARRLKSRAQKINLYQSLDVPVSHLQVSTKFLAHYEDHLHSGLSYPGKLPNLMLRSLMWPLRTCVLFTLTSRKQQGNNQVTWLVLGLMGKPECCNMEVCLYLLALLPTRLSITGRCEYSTQKITRHLCGHNPEWTVPL